MYIVNHPLSGKPLIAYDKKEAFTKEEKVYIGHVCNTTYLLKELGKFDNYNDALEYAKAVTGAITEYIRKQLEKEIHNDSCGINSIIKQLISKNISWFEFANDSDSIVRALLNVRKNIEVYYFNELGYLVGNGKDFWIDSIGRQVSLESVKLLTEYYNLCQENASNED